MARSSTSRAWLASALRRGHAAPVGLILSWCGALSALLIISIILYGCASPPRFNCPPLVAYSPAFQAAAAAEMDGSKPSMEEMIVDYGKTRDACRKGMAKRYPGL